MASNLEKMNGAVSQPLQSFMSGVYSWMAFGLFLTGIIAWVMSRDEGMVLALAQNQPLFWGIMIVQLGVVFGMGFFIQRISPIVATLCFIAYSALTGVTFSILFLIYTQASIASVFFITALTFGAMSVYGIVTKRDLTGLGTFMFMGLIGIIIASIVNLFLRSTMMEFVISCVGVVVFVGLTAYDTQKLYRIGENAENIAPDMIHKVTIMGALTLYLDFINLFIQLLRLFGHRR